MFVIEHGGGGLSSTGQGFTAAMQAANQVAEADMREARFQQERAIAEAQLGITQQRMGIEAEEAARRRSDAAWNRTLQAQGFLDSREDRRSEARQLARDNERRDRTLALNERSADATIAGQGRRLDLAERGFELDERESGLRARSLEADADMRELGADSQRAAQAFNTMRLTGIDPQLMRPALEVAGQIMGGGIGKGLEVMGGMTPTQTELFARMAPDVQGRYLADVASAQKEQERQQILAEAPEHARHLAQIGAITPDEAMAFNTALGEAEDDDQVNALIAGLKMQQDLHVERTVRDTARQTLLDRMAARRLKIAEAQSAMEFDGLGSVTKELGGRMAALDQMMAGLSADAMPDIDAYQRQYSTLAKGLPDAHGGGNVQPRIDLEGMRLDAYEEEQRMRELEAAPPIVPFRQWAATPEATGAVKDSIEFAAEMLYDPKLTDEEKAAALVDLQATHSFAVDDPEFLEAVKAEHEHRENQESKRKEAEHNSPKEKRRRTYESAARPF